MEAAGVWVNPFRHRELSNNNNNDNTLRKKVYAIWILETRQYLPHRKKRLHAGSTRHTHLLKIGQKTIFATTLLPTYTPKALVFQLQPLWSLLKLQRHVCLPFVSWLFRCARCVLFIFDSQLSTLLVDGRYCVHASQASYIFRMYFGYTPFNIGRTWPAAYVFNSIFCHFSSVQ